MSLITVRKCLAFNRVPALLQRTTATSFQLILLCYGPAITRYPAGFPFKQNPHWFTFHRNCSLDHFTLLPCHTMFWSDLHVHFRLASPPRGRGAGPQSSHCPCGQSSIANIQAFTALETHCMLSKGAESLLMNALRPPPHPLSPSTRLRGKHMTQLWQMTRNSTHIICTMQICRMLLSQTPSRLATNCFLLCQEFKHHVNTRTFIGCHG